MQCLTQLVFSYLDSIEVLKQPYSTLFVRTRKTAQVWVTQNGWVHTFINWSPTNDSYRSFLSHLQHGLSWALVELSLTYEYVTILISIFISWFSFDTFLSPLFHCVYLALPCDFYCSLADSPLASERWFTAQKTNAECWVSAYCVS